MSNTIRRTMTIGEASVPVRADVLDVRAAMTDLQDRIRRWGGDPNASIEDAKGPARHVWLARFHLARVQNALSMLALDLMTPEDYRREHGPLPAKDK